MRDSKWIGILILSFIFLASCCAGGRAEDIDAEYVRVGRNTSAYMDPSTASFCFGNFAQSSVVPVKNRIVGSDGEEWLEISYQYDPSIVNPENEFDEADERNVYVRSSDVYSAGVNRNIETNAIIAPGSAYDSIPYAADFSEWLLNRKEDIRLLELYVLTAQKQINVFPTSRNKTVGEGADYSDALLVLRDRNNRGMQLFTPQFTIKTDKGAIYAYPMSPVYPADIPLNDQGITYQFAKRLSSSSLFSDKRVINGIDFILRNSPPYAEYVSWPANSTEASRTAANHALWAFLRDFANQSNKEDIFRNVWAYDTDTFGADYYGYMYWLYDGAARAYTAGNDYEQGNGKVIVITAQNPLKTPLFALMDSEAKSAEVSEKPVQNTKTSTRHETENAKTQSSGINDGQITVEVMDGENLDPVRGIRVTLQRTGTNGDKKTELESGKNGLVVFRGLEYGDYIISVHGNRDYMFASPAKVVTVSEKEKELSYKFEANVAKSDISLNVRNGKTGSALKNIVVELYGKNNSETPVMSGKTDANGGFVFPDMVHGKYKIRVFADEKKYTPMKDVEIDTKDSVSVVIEVAPKLTTINIALKEELNGAKGDATLSGTKLVVMANENIYDSEKTLVYEKNAVVRDDIIIKDAEKSIDINGLWAGSYRIVEVFVPDGYDGRGEAVVDTRTLNNYNTKTEKYEVVFEHNVKYGKIRVSIKDKNGQMIKNEKVEVYLTSAESYRKSPEECRETVEIGQNGTAETKLLPYGNYTVQTTGKHDYKKTIRITGNEDADYAPIVRLSDVKKQNEIIIAVTDENNKVIAERGIEINLYNSNTEMQTVYTNDHGYAVVPQLVYPGEYVLRVKKPCRGYELAEKTVKFTVTDDDSTENVSQQRVNIHNIPVKSSVTVVLNGYSLSGCEQAVDEMSGRILNLPVFDRVALNGGIFAIYTDEVFFGPDGSMLYDKNTKMQDIITSTNGEVTSKPLIPGKYYIQQKTAPVGYVRDADTKRFAIEYPSKENKKLVFTDNHVDIMISIKKEAESMTSVTDGFGMSKQIPSVVPAEGYVFGLFNDATIKYDKGEIKKDTLLISLKTGSNGYSVLKGYLPLGRYYLREIAAPAGYKISDEKYKFSIRQSTSDKYLQIDIEDTAIGQMTGGKVDLKIVDKKTRAGLSGVLVEVLNNIGRVIIREYSDKDGVVQVKYLEPGNYSFRTALSINGYSANMNPVPFQMDFDGNVTGDLVGELDKAAIAVKQVDYQDRPISGVTFALYDDNGNAIETEDTDDNGIAYFNQLMYGTYDIRRLSQVPGYQVNTSHVHLTVDGAYQNNEAPAAVFSSIPNYVIFKTQTENGEPIENMTVEMIDSNGRTVRSEQSNQRGEVIFETVPDGSYKVLENGKPADYLNSGETKHVYIINGRIHNDNTNVFTSIPRSIKFFIREYDSDPVPEVQFSLINKEDNSVVEVERSDGKGMVEFRMFDVGDYLIVQSEKKQGYVDAETLDVEVTAERIDMETDEITAIPDSYCMKCTDSHGRPVENIGFTLYHDNGLPISEMVSDENGDVVFTQLERGKYIVIANELPQGYDGEEYKKEFTVDEKYTSESGEIYTIINRKEGVYINYTELTAENVGQRKWEIAGSVILAIVCCIALMIISNKLSRRKKK